jgi:hypothetical protein
VLVHRLSWWGFGHRYDFDQFIIIIFLGNGDLDHTHDSGDPFFSHPSDSMMTTSSTIAQPGKGMGPNRAWRKVALGDLSERWSGLRVPSANRPVVRGREMMVMDEP